MRLEPPRLEDIGRWDGALLSSTSRLLLPIDELRWAPPGHAWARAEAGVPGGAAGGGGGAAPRGAEGGGAAALGGGGSDEERARAFGPEQAPVVRRLEAAVAARILLESEPVPLRA